MKNFYTADLHLGHANIIKYCNRPFDTAEEMNEKLIAGWNSRVKPEDSVFVLGDFCFRNGPNGKPGEGLQSKSEYYKSRLNGNKIFIRGNHDGNNSLNTNILSLVIDFGGSKAYCVHKPEHSNLSYPVVLCGHIHNNWKTAIIKDSLLINVGVDVHNFRPISLDELIGMYGKYKAGNLVIDRRYK